MQNKFIKCSSELCRDHESGNKTKIYIMDGSKNIFTEIVTETGEICPNQFHVEYNLPSLSVRQMKMK